MEVTRCTAESRDSQQWTDDEVPEIHFTDADLFDLVEEHFIFCRLNSFVQRKISEIFFDCNF